MNIAVVLTKEISEGGAFQYARAISLLLEKHKAGSYDFVFFTTVKNNIAFFRKYNLTFRYLRWAPVDRLFSEITGSVLLNNIFKTLGIGCAWGLERILERYRIDLVYLLTPSDLALALVKTNYIFTLWDLCFRDCVEFPEVRSGREFERREELYRIALGKAAHIIVDSEFSRKNIMRRYGIAEERITVFPLMPSVGIRITEQEYVRNFIDIRQKYQIKGEYIFYPAQLWSHKNHQYIVHALKILKDSYHITLHAVFSGSDKGNKTLIQKKAKELEVEAQVHYIGFAEEREMPYLYKQALALVMPTYFGPTNIPPLEAFSFGCPVLYSDLPFLREQAEGAVLWVDLKDPHSLCEQLMKVIKKTAEVKAVVEEGKRKIAVLPPDEWRWGVLKQIFDDFHVKLQCWK